MAAQATLCGTALHYTAQRGQEAELAQLLEKVQLYSRLHGAALPNQPGYSSAIIWAHGQVCSICDNAPLPCTVKT